MNVHTVAGIRTRFAPGFPTRGFSDVLREDSPPRARLLNACKVSNEIWDITFEKGGFTTLHERVRARFTGHGWEFTKIPPGRRQLSAAVDHYRE